jgi:hypothetical protein
VPTGPARTVLQWRVFDAADKLVELRATPTPLPSLIVPGQTVPAAVMILVPPKPGIYQVTFAANREGEAVTEPQTPPADSALSLRLLVEASNLLAPRRGPALMEAVQAALVRADKLKHLPDDYTDISEGWLARWKRRIKSKLLNNFKRAYVDVLSRQQSAFNQQVLQLLQELAEHCATLEHAMEQRPGEAAAFAAGDAPAGLTDQQRVAELEERLARLECLMLEKEKLGS